MEERVKAGEPGAGGRHSAEDLYAEFLETRGEGGLSFETWVQRYPGAAFELELLHEESRVLRTQASLFRGEKSFAGHVPPGLEGGKVVADYELVRLIGQGGMGQVWEARQLSLGGRRVALKFVRPEGLTQRRLELFQREARAGGRLHHAGIVSVLDYGETDGLAWIAMEYVAGAWTLRDAMSGLGLDELPADYDRLVAIFVAQVADAMQASHDAGIIHRDLKPANILIAEDGRPKVMDFGLARIVDEASLSLTGELGGTYYYMSPEQVAAKRMTLDARSDVFSLGAVLYEMLSLQRPFQGDTSHQVVEQVLLKEPPDLRSIRSRVAPDLVWICGKALEKDRDRRYASMADLAADLRAFLADASIVARPPSLATQFRRWRRRHPAAMAAMSVLTFAAVAVSVLLLILARTNIHLEAERERVSAANAKLEKANAELERRGRNSEQQRAKLEVAARDNRRQAEEILRLSMLQNVEDRAAESDELWPAHPAMIERLESWIQSTEEITDTLPEHEGALVEVRERLARAGDLDPEEVLLLGWRRDLLEELVGELRALTDSEKGLLAPEGADPEHGWSVPRRLALAESLLDEFSPGEEYRAAWDEALPALRERYADVDWKPQMGLLPLGPDPESGLWEFWHVQSGERPLSDARGTHRVNGSSGLVLVLVPGDAFLMGATPVPGEPNYDAAAKTDEVPVHEVRVSPFFLSKYEMTQGQWQRLTGANPSYYKRPISGEEPYGKANPVEQVSWEDCIRWLPRLGLTLPSEAQWEYASRAGTTSPWWTGPDPDGIVLAEAGNLADVHAVEAGWAGARDDLDDGFMAHAPVGAFRANAFGLHDTLGNVSEFCLDGYAHLAYAYTSKLDPVSPGDEEGYHVVRGGGFTDPPKNLRSSFRYNVPAGFRNYDMGVRPARPLEP